MKSNAKYILVVPLILLSMSADAQVIISLLFGDKLNSEKIEFGLVGGENVSYLEDVEGSKGLWNFNLGFYFHINLKNQSYLSTGVLVKSNVGATGMSTYPVGDPDLDSVFVNGMLTSKINYFYVPILFHQRLHDNRWYVEGGFQLGLRNLATDVFEVEDFGGTVEYTIDTRDSYKRFDGGLMGGAGYKFKRTIKSISAGVNYYYGLNNVSTIPDMTLKNSSIYLYLKIPIGAGKAEKRAQEKAQEGSN